MRAPRTRSRSAPRCAIRSTDPNSARPCTRPFEASKPIAAKNAWLFPAPDSPTTPTHSPRPTLSAKFLTASTSPSGVVNVTLRSSRRRTSPGAAEASTPPPPPSRTRASSTDTPDAPPVPAPGPPTSTPAPSPALTPPPVPPLSSVPRIKRIAKTIAHEVETQQQRYKKNHRHQQHPGRGLHLLGPVVDEAAQARERLLNSEPEETQKALESDHLRNREGCIHRHGPHEVGHDVVGDDPGDTNARRPGRLDELAPLQTKSLATHDACSRQPPHRADRNQQDRQAAARKHGRQDDHNEEIRQRVQHIDETHHPLVRASAHIARDGAPGHPNHETHGAGQHADHQRDSHPVQRPHEQIAPQAIGAEPV